MRKTVVIGAALLCIFIFSNCAKPKPARAERTREIKARMYDLDRELSKAEKAVIKEKLTRKQKAGNVRMKKALEKARADLAALQERVDALESVTAEAWDGFTLDIEQGINSLGTNIEHIMGAYRENQQEETQPQ